MTGNKSVVFSMVIMSMLLVAGVGSTTELHHVSLEEAEQIAYENSISLYLARVGVEEAELNYRQAEGAAIMRPSPITSMQAQAGLDLARQKYQMDKDNLALTVKTDFFNVLRLQSLLGIAQEGLESAERHLNVTQRKFELGTVTQLDVIQAARNVLNRQADIVSLEHNLELSEMKFRQTLGLSLNSAVLPERSAFEIEPVNIALEDDLEFALANREEIMQLKLAVAVAEKNVELVDNDYTPVLTLAQAQLNRNKMEAQLQQAKQLLTMEIKQNYLAIKDAEQRIPVLQKGIEEVEEMLRLTELMFDSDMVVANDLADTQIAVASAKNDMVNAIYDYNLATARYTFAVARALR